MPLRKRDISALLTHASWMGPYAMNNRALLRGARFRVHMTRRDKRGRELLIFEVIASTEERGERGLIGYLQFFTSRAYLKVKTAPGIQQLKRPMEALMGNFSPRAARFQTLARYRRPPSRTLTMTV